EYVHAFAPATLAAGDYPLEVTVGVTGGDAVPSNDTVSTSLGIAPLVVVTPESGYFEDFEADAGGWVAGGTNASWAHGTPSYSFIPAAGEGSAAWVTNLTGPYNNDELSYLGSPCFDLSALTEDPTLSFLHIFRL